MLKIYEILVRILKKEYSGASPSFKAGFKKCLTLLLIGIKKNPSYNQSLRVRELERELKDSKKKIRDQNTRIAILIKKLGAKTLIDSSPDTVFYFHRIYLHKKDGENSPSFGIVVNMNIDSLGICLFNFKSMNVYESEDDAKAKLLHFINTKNYLGYKAYKSIDQAIKEGVNKEDIIVYEA